MSQAQSLRLAQPVVRDGVNVGVMKGGKVHPSLLGANGAQEVVVRLQGEAVGAMADESASAQLSRKAQLEAEQNDFIARRGDVMNKVMGRTQMVLNAVFAEVDSARLAELAADPSVARIAPVGEYRMHLAETVPYIGATAVQNQGFDGSGIKVAVFDSGIDYTHADLGGSGDLADYQAAIADPASADGMFPTAKVVGGVDLTGEVWPNGPLQPDEDPIDFDGHGTHVADIIAGQLGVAPGVELYAVKVCSSVSTSCSGIALIQGMEFAVDPNGDGDTSDRVDIINMSLGADYGQPFDDDLSLAIDGATALGVLTVASAGNGGDLPYITGTPAAAPTALSVAQTEVPSASLTIISAAGASLPAVFQSWSTPPAGVLSGPVQYADGAGGNLDGCLPFASGSLTGLVVLVDRGACNFTTKIFNIANAGGTVGIIGLIAAGAPFDGGFADPGGPITIPGYMIDQADSNFLKASVGEEAVIDPDVTLSLAGSIRGTSSRGPQHESTQLIKPEIGAPGASVSAEVGTGTERTPFGGTSGAAPMVSGSAALLLEAEPKLDALEIKARLVTAADSDITATGPVQDLTPITRIGGGEVRVDAALSNRVAAWDAVTKQPALSFGFEDVAEGVELEVKLLRVRNFSNKNLWLSVDTNFRFADDEANGAVAIGTLPKLFVRRRSDAFLPVILRVRGEDLRDNAMSSGAEGANPDALTFNEYDGYLTLSGSGVSLSVPWHVLPRKDSFVLSRKLLNFDESGLDQVNLANKGVGVAQNDGYSLLAVSENLPEGAAGEGAPTPDIRGVGVRTLPVPAGFCSANDSFLWQFAVNTWERQQHLRSVSHQLLLDTNQDGIDDYIIANLDFNFFSNPIDDGRQLVWTLDLATGLAQAFFFAEHAMNTGNTVLTICGEQIGMDASDFLATSVDVDVFTEDFIFGGPGDSVLDLTVTPLGERFFANAPDIDGRSSDTMEVIDFGPWPGNTPDLGVLLVTDGDRGQGARGGASRFTEARYLYSKEVLKALKSAESDAEVEAEAEAMP